MRPLFSYSDLQIRSRFYRVLFRLSLLRFLNTLSSRFRRRSLQRRVICFAVAFNLVLWPGPGLFTQNIIGAASQALSTRFVLYSYQAYFLRSLFSQDRRPPHDTMADRAAAVTRIQINPIKFVGYENEGTAFTALPTDFLDRTVQGVKFSWESSDTNKLEIDDAGRARFLQAGLARVTCRAGTASATAPVLIRQGHRPRQTDAEWRVDQGALGVDGNIIGTTRESGGVGSVLSSLLDKLAPTVFAQDVHPNDLGYDQLWNEPRNLVGSPRNGVVEAMPLGSVLPEGSNFKWAVPIVSLGGRGLAANLTMYYNSRVWSRRDTRMAFDAITGWPAPGFSLGFGRMLFYGESGGIGKYLWVEPDGTRRYLGTGAYLGDGGYASGGRLKIQTAVTSFIQATPATEAACTIPMAQALLSPRLTTGSFLPTSSVEISTSFRSPTSLTAFRAPAGCSRQ
jgi:hypothetical protein